MQSHELNLDQLNDWVKRFCSNLSNKQLVLLSGPLGAGKTELVKKILQNFGCDEVNSPTYGLIHEYAVPNRENVFHVDLYRIEDGEDLESSGFWDLFDKDQGLIFVEWADQLPESQWPLHWELVSIKIDKVEGKDTRLYNVHASSHN